MINGKKRQVITPVGGKRFLFAFILIFDKLEAILY